MSSSRYWVRRGGLIPGDVVEIGHRDEIEVQFYPAGGGVARVASRERFDAEYREVDSREYSSPEPYPATFDIDGLFGGLAGYSTGHRWNGWACPLFPRFSCDRIVDLMGGVTYDPGRTTLNRERLRGG